MIVAKLFSALCGAFVLFWDAWHGAEGLVNVVVWPAVAGALFVPLALHVIGRVGGGRDPGLGTSVLRWLGGEQWARPGAPAAPSVPFCGHWWAHEGCEWCVQMERRSLELEIMAGLKFDEAGCMMDGYPYDEGDSGERLGALHMLDPDWVARAERSARELKEANERAARWAEIENAKRDARAAEQKRLSVEWREQEARRAEVQQTLLDGQLAGERYYIDEHGNVEHWDSVGDGSLYGPRHFTAEEWERMGRK